MKLYRNLNSKELGKMVVIPSPFKANNDSTATEGVKSFWFDTCRFFGTSGVIAVGSSNTFSESVMTYTVVDPFGKSTVEKVKEITVEKEVVIEEIIISSSYVWAEEYHFSWCPETKKAFIDGEECWESDTCPEDHTIALSEKVLGLDIYKQLN